MSEASHRPTDHIRQRWDQNWPPIGTGIVDGDCEMAEDRVSTWRSQLCIYGLLVVKYLVFFMFFPSAALRVSPYDQMLGGNGNGGTPGKERT